MKNNLVFKEITQLKMPYLNLHEILHYRLFLKWGIYTWSFYRSFESIQYCRPSDFNKLQYYGTDGTALEWFKSYLNNRKQYISSQDVPKNRLHIICGVLQGSIVRPLLFLIYMYVNNLFKVPNPNGSYV